MALTKTLSLNFVAILLFTLMYFTISKVGGEQFNGLDMLEKRLLKSEQKIHEQKISKIMTLLDEISPNDNLQERIFNFSNFYKDYGKNMIDIIKNNLDPLDQKFSVVEI